MPYWDKRQVAPGVKLQWGPLSAPQLYGVLHFQSTFMGESERVSANWLKRQQDFAGLALRTGTEMSKAGLADPAYALKLLTDLQTASAQHLSDDMRECTEMAARCMSCLFPGSNRPASSADDTNTPSKSAAQIPDAA